MLFALFPQLLSLRRRVNRDGDRFPPASGRDSLTGS